MAARIVILTEGMRGMRQNFERLASPEPLEVAKERLSQGLRDTALAVELAIPRDAGDYRRPGGTLAESTRFEVEAEGDFWKGTIKVGSEDDTVPYATWVRFKNINKGKPEYMFPTEEYGAELGERMSAMFDEVFGRE